MLATLTVALSLAATTPPPTVRAVGTPAAAPAIDVPFLPQTDAMCGGAAAAMVFRYWGDAHADVQEFAKLVDRRAGGIVTTALVDAVTARGWRAGRIASSLDALKARIADRQPVVVLVPERGNRYHYVVVTGAGDDDILIHDPSWGPSRSMRAADFERAWRAAGFWSLLILPPAAGTASTASAAIESGNATAASVSACDARLAQAVAEVRALGLDRADDLLGRVHTECPDAAGPLHELSGVRFAQRRWADAESLARAALERDPADAYALDILGSSLFMRDDAVGALRAWNRIDKPQVNLVRIEGARHTRQQTLADILGIRSNTLLDANRFELARRRVRELPGQSGAAVKVRPEADGFATVDVVVTERPVLPRGAAEWLGAGARAAIDREVALDVPGPGGQGGVWSAKWRWWNNRPAVSVAFAAPGSGRLPGVWRVEGSWQAESYATGPAQPAPFIRQTRTRGELSVSDWLTGRLRYSLSAGLDAWHGAGSFATPEVDGDRKALSIGGGLERRFFGDLVAVSGDAGRWYAVDAGRSFDSAGARVTARSSNDMQGWVLTGSTGAIRVSDEAPLGVWPGAGEGRARPPLVRAHPLLDEGIIPLGGASVFGRTLAYGSVEAQRWMARPALVRIGPAVFVDIARATRRGTEAGDAQSQIDAGAGVRVKVPGAAGVLRIDVARGVRDGATALTFGWMY